MITIIAVVSFITGVVVTAVLYKLNQYLRGC